MHSACPAPSATPESAGTCRPTSQYSCAVLVQLPLVRVDRRRCSCRCGLFSHSGRSVSTHRALSGLYLYVCVFVSVCHPLTSIPIDRWPWRQPGQTLQPPAWSTSSVVIGTGLNPQGSGGVLRLRRAGRNTSTCVVDRPELARLRGCGEAQV